MSQKTKIAGWIAVGALAGALTTVAQRLPAPRGGLDAWRRHLLSDRGASG